MAEPWDQLHRRLGRAVPWGFDDPDEGLSEFLTTLPPHSRVLDLGGGNGRNALLAAASGMRVVVVDISAAGLALADERAAQLRLVQGSALALPFAHNSFDAMYDVGCLHTLPPPQWLRYVQEIVRVVRPGGLIYLNQRLRLPAEGLANPVFWVEGLPEWGIAESEVPRVFAGLDVLSVRPYQGRPPERFLKLLLRCASVGDQTPSDDSDERC